ncbi:MAG: deoxyribodipyrimidine photo-lyase [Actinobacteria bacterium]|nr:deoxyribodipyrimidine photo-lyase [Actinomycetota bacterium]
MSRSIMWFRRDLRLSDNPALLAAIDAGEEIVPVFILDPQLINATGTKRLAYMAASLHSLDESLGNKLHVCVGDQVDVLNELKKKYNATSVHISAEYEPYGVARDSRVEAAGIELTRTGSPYAVAPGRVKKPSDATNYRVYTPFYRGWLAHGWRAAVAAPKIINAVTPEDKDRNFPTWQAPAGSEIPAAGEKAAHERFKKFKTNGLDSYDETRNFAGIDGTSKMSAHLKWGEIHPRTLLAGLGESKAHDTFRKEIAWREFYADVLHNYPHTDKDYYAPQFANMRYDEPGEKFIAWREGKTGYPFVDAGMRQLLKEGWMHNRVRMVVASFLAKDLHIEWQHGALFFEEHLVDFDVASNAHGWQWTAGCGTDASPYYRVFNPIEQGKRFDENGDYIRKYVPELAHLKADEIHEPWDSADGYKHGYAKKIVEHSAERIESLARLEEIKVRNTE